jgi:hypothetical protein
MAHSGAPILRRIAPLYAEAAWDIFVHLDRKVDQSAYVKALGDGARICRLVDDPVEVFWGGYSMIEAEIKLIEAAKQVANHDRYILVSDDTVPIHPAPVLESHFANETDFIELNRQEPGSEFHGRYAGFFFLDHPATAAVRRGHRLLSELDGRFFDKMAEIATLRQTGKSEVDVYWGSQFWSLTASTVEFVLERIAADRRLRQSFEFSAISDELLFQSVIGSAQEGRTLEPGPMYADWHVPQGPRIYSNMEELPYDFLPHHAFIRKISPGAHQLVDTLTTQLAQGRGIYRFGTHEQPVEGFTVDGNGKTLAVLTLHAPPPSAPVPAKTAWHPIERAGRVRFRWTASDTIEWVLDGAVPQADQVRVVVPLMMVVAPDFADTCEMSFSGQSRRLRRRGRDLFADFEPPRDEQMVIRLQTPAPISPFQLKGSTDRRPLGLAVRLADTE